MRKKQTSLRLDEPLHEAYDRMAAGEGTNSFGNPRRSHRQDRSDVFREALHVYAQMHAPEDWNRRHFAMSKSEVLSEEAKRLLGMLRRHWTEGDGAGRTELDTAKMVQHLAASLAELSWLARALGSDVGEWAASPEVTAQFQDMVTSLDGLSGPLFQIARALDRQTGLA